MAKTWGFLKILLFIPYEIYYGLKFGFGTLFSMNNDELDVDDEHKVNSTEYFPTPYYISKKTFSLIKNQLTDSTFIDFGAGAGRMLIFASQYSTKKVVGVEFSKTLCEIGEKNLKKHFGSKEKINKWEMVCCDAREFQIELSYNVFFFYDPFDDLIMKEVLQNILNSYKESPRRITVIYISPRYRNVLKQMGFRELFSEVNKYKKGFSIFNLS